MIISKSVEEEIQRIHLEGKRPVLIIGREVARSMVLEGTLRNPGKWDDKFYMGARVVVNEVYPDKCEVVLDHD